MSEAVAADTRRTGRWFLVALAVYCLGIVVESSMSMPPGLATVERHVSDKVVHAAAFFGMALLAIGVARTNRPARGLGAHLAFGVAFTTLFGVSDEVHQAFTPGRSPDPYDVLADAIGACVAALLVYAVVTIRRSAR